MSADQTRDPLLSYQVDFICFGGIVIEVKALSAIGNVEVAQLLNYLIDHGIKRLRDPTRLSIPRSVFLPGGLVRLAGDLRTNLCNL